MVVRKASELHVFSRITQSMVEACAIRYSEHFESQGLSVRAQVVLKELRGGACGVCGKEYVLIEYLDPVFGQFKYHKAQCTCERDEEERSVMAAYVESEIEDAGVPVKYLGQTFENWDWGLIDDKIKAANNEAMRTVMEFVKVGAYRSHGLLLYGPTGTGKTRLAVCVMRAACASGMKVSFQQMASITGRFIDRDKGVRLVEQLGGVGLAIFDDFDKLATESEWVRSQVFAVIDAMISNGRCPVLTTNIRGVPDMEAKLGEPAVSRLLAGCDWVEVPGDDYRIRQAAMRLARRKE